MKRFKSKLLWASVASLLLLIASQAGILDYFGITSEKIQILVDSVLSILVLLGILSNPENAG